MNKRTLSLIALALLITTLLATTVSADVFSSIEDTITKTLGPYADKTYVKVAINAIIMGLLAFIILAVVKSKDSDPKTGMQLTLAMLGLSVIVAIAIGNRFVWDLQLVSNFLHAKVAINTIIYVALFYGTYAMFGKAKVQEKGTSANIFAILAIVVLAFTISMGPFQPNKTWEQIGDNYQYFWQKEDVIRLKWFAFGNSQTEDGKYTEHQLETAIKADNPNFLITADSKDTDKSSPILKGTGLFIFLFGSLLLFWLFTELKISENYKQLNWILAIFLASNIANSGMEKGTFVNMAMVIFGYLLYRGMAKGTENKKLKLFQIAFVVGITYFLFSTMFPEDVSPISPLTVMLPGMVGAAAGDVWGSIAGIPLKILFFVLAGVFGVFYLMVHLSRGKYEVTANKDFGNWIRSGFWRNFRKFRDMAPDWMFFLHWTEAKEKFDPDRMTPVVKNLRAELQMHMDWMLRYEVYFAKLGSVEKLIKKAAIIDNSYHEDYGNSFQFSHAKMDEFKWGTRAQVKTLKNNPGKVSPTSLIIDLPEKEYKSYHQHGYDNSFKSRKHGFLNHNYLVLKSFQSLYESLEDTEQDDPRISIAERPEERITGILNRHYNEKFSKLTLSMSGKKGITPVRDFSDFSNPSGDVGAAHEYFRAYWNFGLTHHMQMVHQELFDQYLMDGPYPRSYRFAKYEAPHQLYKVSVNGRENKSYFFSPNWRTLTLHYEKKKPSVIHADPTGKYGPRRKPLEHIHGDRLHEVEVDWRGFILKDLENIKFGRFDAWNMKGISPGTGGGNPVGHAFIRRIKTTDIYMGDVIQSARRMKKDWNVFMQTVRYGRHARYSRRVQDYIRYHRSDITTEKRQTLEKLQAQPDGINKFVRTMIAKSKPASKHEYYGEWNQRVQIQGRPWKDTRFSLETGSVIPPPGDITQDKPAFDREALKRYGDVPLWCRSEWYDESDKPSEAQLTDSNDPISDQNPFPAISMWGNSRYFLDYFSNLIEPVEHLKNEANRFTYSSTGDPFVNIEKLKKKD